MNRKALMPLERRINVADRVMLGEVSVWLLGDPESNAIRVHIDGPPLATIEAITDGPGWRQVGSREVILRPGARARIGESQIWYMGSPQNDGVEVWFDAPKSVRVHVAEQGKEWTPDKTGKTK